MRIQDLLSEERAAVPPKPRNFVAKNAKMGGAGQHKDKKKAEKQGDVKHKKELATMEGVRDLGYDAQSLIMKLRRDIEEKRLQPTREAVLSAARELAGDMDFAPELLVQQVLGKGVAEVSLGDYRKKAKMQKAQSQMGAMFNNDPEKQKQHHATVDKRETGLNRLKARDEVARKTTADKQMADNIARLPELKAEYERMKAEYTSLGGSNWQYADREQNLTDRERKARSMESSMNNLWRTISAAEKAQKSESVDEGAMIEDSIRPNLVTALKKLGFNGPFKLGQLPEWMKELEDGRFDEDTSIMTGGDDPAYDPWVAKGNDYGYAYGMESGYQIGLSAQEVFKQAQSDTQKSESVDEGAMSELDIEIGEMLDGYIAKYQDGLLDADHLGAMIDKVAAKLSQQHHTDQNEMARHVSNYVADAVGEE